MNNMIAEKYSFEFENYESDTELTVDDKFLLNIARSATQKAYAPYSNFLVGAAALLTNNEIVTGSNQENASFPAGMCAERSLLASCAQLFSDVSVDTIAISYFMKKGENNTPIYPCGFCRQVIAEYEVRFDKSIRLILSGQGGNVFIFPQASMLLPFAFAKNRLLI